MLLRRQCLKHKKIRVKVETVSFWRSELNLKCVCAYRYYTTVYPFQNWNTLQLELATSRAGRQRIARQRRIQQPRPGRHMQRIARTNVKDCKAEADTTAQSWETHVQGLQGKGTAAQSWETNVDTGRHM